MARSEPSLGRREDDRLLRGAGRFVADLRLAGCLDAAFVRSEVAHGELISVDLRLCRTVPGVLAAWSAVDLEAEFGAVLETPPMMDPESVRGRPWPALATDRVRYFGQPLAVVVAADRYLAEDGRDAAQVTIRQLPALLDPTAAADASPLFPGLSNVASEKEFGKPIADSVWREAAVVVEAGYRQQLLAHTFLEARAILVQPEAGGGLTVYASHQAPHRLRRDLAGVLGLDEDAVRVVVGDVGGGFGGKTETYPEYLAVAAAAVRLGRPVRWVEDRAESLAGPPHGRGQHQRVRMAADAEGRLLAYELHIDADVGGYPHAGAFVPMQTAMMARGAYEFPFLHARTRAVLTTTAPTTPYRGAGRPEAAAAVERTIDQLARRLHLDPAEIRRRNFIRPHLFPFESGTGYTYDSGDYPAALELALATVDYPGWRAEQQLRRTTGQGRPLGIGLCTYVERSGAGPEFGAVEACPDGTFLALSGCCATGQGHETAFPQVVAKVLGVEQRRVRLVEGDTAAVPQGTGTFASRSMQTGGEALHAATEALIDLARDRFADHVGLPLAQVRYEAGAVHVDGAATSLGELAARTGPLRAERVVEPPPAFPFGAYVAVVELDPDLGTVEVLHLVAVDDYGVVVDPLLVTGQTYGSAVQGLGQVLHEECSYDQNGRPVQANLLDYLLPTFSELPPLHTRETTTPNPNTALGAKGAGEAGCIGVPPAVLNAVADALDLDDPSILQMPLTPARCHEAMRSAAAGTR
jgi:carbon-monoxide dehydrogenase large subunit